MNIRSEIKKKWPPRKSTSHKGDYGRVFLLAGSKGLTGAAYLASVACIKSGAGLVTLGVPESVYPILARRSAEVMVRPFPSTKQGSFAYRGLKEILQFAKSQDVLALGPGLSQNPETQKLVRKLLTLSSLKNIILDADGLNAFQGRAKDLPKQSDLILTPHPGEFKRLFGFSAGSTGAERKKSARIAAKKSGVTLILKGHHTIVAQGPKLYVNPTGNPGMASGGTGDVLTGILAALLGQKFSAWDAARFGVFIHGLAGDLAAKKVGQVSLTASDLLAFLPVAIKNL